MKKTISLILIAAMTALTGLSAATNNKSKGKEKQKEVANFNGKIKSREYRTEARPLSS